MYRPSFLPLAGLLLLGITVFSCRQSEHSPAPNASVAERPAPVSTEAGEAAVSSDEAPSSNALAKKGMAPPPQAFQSAAAAVSRWDTLKKLVRTAELRFRTPDVLQATLGIEDIVRQNGGFVLDDNLTQTPEQQHLTPVSRDSSLETSVLNIQAQLVFRVPYAQLDTTLRALARWADALDYRRIHAQDETLKALEKQLTEARNRQYQTRIEAAAAQPGGKLQAVTDAIDKSFAGRAAADAARLEQLRLDDAVQLSTVQLDLYQRPVVRRELVANLKQVASWQPGFGNQLSEALLDGWRGMQALVLFVARLWSLLLIGAVAGLAIWRWRRGPGLRVNAQ